MRKYAKITFVDTVLGLMKPPNADIYITGSNSKMLSSDIVTEFRDRGDEVRVYQLSFSEFLNAYSEDKSKAWREYYTNKLGADHKLKTSLKLHDEESFNFRGA